MMCGRAQGLFRGSRSGNSERDNFTALHSTSMPAVQQVYAVPGKGDEHISMLRGVGVPGIR